jgi:hypothetical protein
MKTIKIFAIALLLTGSTTLMAAQHSRSLGNSKTELVVKSLDLSKKQARKMAAIEQKYAKKDALLFAQSRSLQQQGYMDETVQMTFFITLNNHKNAKMEEIKSILSDEQWMVYENSRPTPNFMRERFNERIRS